VRRRGLCILFGASSGVVPSIEPIELAEAGSVFFTRPHLADYMADAAEIRWRAADLLAGAREGTVQAAIHDVLPLASASTAHRLMEGRETRASCSLPSPEPLPPEPLTPRRPLPTVLSRGQGGHTRRLVPRRTRPMMQRFPRPTRRAVIAGGAASLTLLSGIASAQTRTVRLAKQFGIGYLPLTIMEERKLLEAQGTRLGLDLRTEWVQFTGGTPMNEALVSGNLDFASGGVGPLLTIWARTQTNLGVKGVAALNSMPLFLNSINPSVKTIADFTEKDRIALPAVRTSIQAVTLQMAAERRSARASTASSTRSRCRWAIPTAIRP
jgi:hypothetical protein